MTDNIGQLQQKIYSKLHDKFQPKHLGRFALLLLPDKNLILVLIVAKEVINESYMHSVPRGSETHFKVVVVSDMFKGQSVSYHISSAQLMKPLLDRHRNVNNVLGDEFKAGLHALSIQAKTLEQWEQSGQKVEPSPACLGGMKHEKKV